MTRLRFIGFVNVGVVAGAAVIATVAPEAAATAARIAVTSFSVTAAACAFHALFE